MPSGHLTHCDDLHLAAIPRDLSYNEPLSGGVNNVCQHVAQQHVHMRNVYAEGQNVALQCCIAHASTLFAASSTIQQSNVLASGRIGRSATSLIYTILVCN